MLTIPMSLCASQLPKSLNNVEHNFNNGSVYGKHIELTNVVEKSTSRTGGTTLYRPPTNYCLTMMTCLNKLSTSSHI